MTTDDMHQSKIFLTARSCVGSHFRHQGRNPEYGLDCVGLIVYVSKVLGLGDFDMTTYKKTPRREAITAIASKAGFTERSKAEMKPGDVVIMRIGKYLEHTAIISDRGIIHACEKYGRVVEHGLDSEWRSRIISVHSFPNSSNPDSSDNDKGTD